MVRLAGRGLEVFEFWPKGMNGSQDFEKSEKDFERSRSPGKPSSERDEDKKGFIGVDADASRCAGCSLVGASWMGNMRAELSFSKV